MNHGRSLFASALVALMLAPGVAQARAVVEGDGSTPELIGLESKERAAAMKAESLAEAAEKRRAKRAKKLLKKKGFAWPIVGAINTPFSGGHAGIDIEGVTGDKIIAAQSGTVTFAGDDGDGYGVKVIIEHASGYETLYSHLSSIAVSEGPISQGEVVGAVGCTGSCTGDHLHFEILHGGVVTDPLPLLP